MTLSSDLITIRRALAFHATDRPNPPSLPELPPIARSLISKEMEIVK
jgi:hypothetical protein